MKKINFKSFISLSILASITMISTKSFSFPQFIKDGYFSCTTCHVSTAGGDALTPYGRTMSEQKLAAFANEGEGTALFSKVYSPSALLLGGHFRRIQIFSDNAKARSADIFVMQRELDLGYWSENISSYFTATPFSTLEDKDNEKWGISKWMVRGSINENLSISVGAFRPKFGLNLNDHNAYIMRSTGHYPGSEVKLAEVAYFSEFYEMSVSQAMPVLPDRGFEQDVDKVNTTIANVSFFLFEKHRLSMSALQDKSDESKNEVIGTSGTFVLNPKVTTSIEVNLSNHNESGTIRKSIESYSDLVFEFTKGFWIQPYYELMQSTRNDPSTKMEKQGLRLSLFPRPHFDIKASMGQIKNQSTYQYSNYGSIVFHYWL